MKNDDQGTGKNQPGEALASAASRALGALPTGRAVEFRNHWYTYGDLKAISDRVAALISQSGADSLVPIALAPRNRPSALGALFSLVANRRTVQMVYAYQSGAALASNLARLQSSILIAAAEDFSPEVVDQLRNLGCAGIALTEMSAKFVPGLETVTRAVAREGVQVPRIEILTSGTTGPARQYPLSYEMLEQRFIVSNVAIGDGTRQDQAPVLICYSLANISGLYTAVPALLYGLPIVLHEKFSLAEWHDYVIRYRPGEIFLPPAGMQMALDAAIPPEDLSSARFIRSGMTHLPLHVQREFEERYNMPVLLSYGATEFGGVVVQMTEELASEWGKRKLGSTGRAIGEVRVRVVSPSSGEELAPGEEGVLEVLVPSISPAWQRTSDLAVIDEDEFVFIRGRADGAIMRGGFKLLPETIEEALLRHPDIAGAAVTGIEDRRLGEVPAAVMELRQGAMEPSAEELEDFLRKHVPATHIPVVWRFVDNIPRTTSVKIARRDLKELFAREPSD